MMTGEPKNLLGVLKLNDNHGLLQCLATNDYDYKVKSVLLELLIEKYQVNLFEPYPIIKSLYPTHFFYKNMSAASEIVSAPQFLNSPKLVSLLLAKNIKLPRKGWENNKLEKISVLLAAVRNNHYRSKQIDVKQINEKGALHLAINKFIKSKADIHQQDKNKCTHIMNFVLHRYDRYDQVFGKHDVTVDTSIVDTSISNIDRSSLHLVTAVRFAKDNYHTALALDILKHNVEIKSFKIIANDFIQLNKITRLTHIIILTIFQKIIEIISPKDYLRSTCKQR